MIKIQNCDIYMYYVDIIKINVHFLIYNNIKNKNWSIINITINLLILKAFF